MAYVHVSKSKGHTIETFRTVSAKHNPPQDIDGLLAWAAGSDEDGLHVVTVWGSKAQADRWVAEQLFPAFQAAGIAADMANAEFTEYETGELYIRLASAPLPRGDPRSVRGSPRHNAGMAERAWSRTMAGLLLTVAPSPRLRGSGLGGVGVGGRQLSFPIGADGDIQAG